MQPLSSLGKVKARYSHAREIFHTKRNSNTSDTYICYLSGFRLRTQGHKMKTCVTNFNSSFYLI